MALKTLVMAAAATAALALAAPAMAAPPSGTVSANNNLCTLADLSPAAAACSGFYSGNNLNGSADSLATQAAAFAALGVGSLTEVEHHDTSGTNDNVFEFDTLLNGLTVIGVHWGVGAGPPIPGAGTGGGTAFYKLNLAADAQLASITGFLLNGNSNYALYKTSACVGSCDGGGGGQGGVPEPATWAMMIIGFGGVGAMIRRRRTVFG
jgi:hypothetical protein